MQQEREDLVDYWKRTGRKALWGSLLRHELEAALASQPVVLMPIGSVEQHGPACPLDVDIVGAYAVCLRAAQAIEGLRVSGSAAAAVRTDPHTTWAGSAP